MAEKLSFNHLTSSEFEEFCVDLLKQMGFTNVNWRKGTGHGSSPADQGRDIEADHIREDIDKSKLVEKWFIECKQYKRGVPFQELNGALAWADANSPSVLLIIASNALSNSAKQGLEDYKRSHNPNFRIKYWELKDLETNLIGKISLAKKYGLPQGYDFLEIMHPAHIDYIRQRGLNTLGYLFKCFDEIDITKRDAITSELWDGIIVPRMRAPKTGEELMGDLYIDPVNYETFKEKSFELVKNSQVEDYLLASFMINYLLQVLFGLGDKTVIEQKVFDLKQSLEFMDTLETSDPSNHDWVKKGRPLFQKHIQEMPDRIKRNHEIYTYFCDKVVTRLLEEPSLEAALSRAR